MCGLRGVQLQIEFLGNTTSMKKPLYINYPVPLEYYWCLNLLFTLNGILWICKWAIFLTTNLTEKLNL